MILKDFRGFEDSKGFKRILMDLKELKRFKGIKRDWAGKDKLQGFRDLRT